MSRENIQVCQEMLEAFGRRDWARAFEPVDPEIEMDTTRAPLEGLAGVYRGREEVAGFWLQWLEAWGEQEFDAELIDAGDQVVMWVAGHQLRGRRSGIEVDIPPYGWVAELRDGKIVRSTMFMDREEALEAAGLSR